MPASRRIAFSMHASMRLSVRLSNFQTRLARLISDQQKRSHYESDGRQRRRRVRRRRHHRCRIRDFARGVRSTITAAATAAAGPAVSSLQSTTTADRLPIVRFHRPSRPSHPRCRGRRGEFKYSLSSRASEAIGIFITSLSLSLSLSLSPPVLPFVSFVYLRATPLSSSRGDSRREGERES